MRGYLQRVAGGVHTEAEGLVERRLAVVTTHSGLLLDDPLLGGDVHHIELHIKICWHRGTTIKHSAFRAVPARHLDVVMKFNCNNV